jgi:hypothetical protein
MLPGEELAAIERMVLRVIISASLWAERAVALEQHMQKQIKR